MEHEKSFLYTLVLGVCVIISLLLVGKMLLYRPVPIHTPHMAQAEQQESGTGKPVYISDSDLAKLLQKQLPADFPIENVKISVSKDGNIAASGVVHREKLETESDMALLRSMLKWLPEKFEISASLLALSIDGRLELSLQEIQAAGFSLPVDQMPKGWMDTLNASVDTALKENCAFQSIRLLDGGLQLIK